VGVGNCVTACELVVFTDKAADPVPPEHANAACLLSTAASGVPASGVHFRGHEDARAPSPPCPRASAAGAFTLGMDS
jgi:hypothetical protein